MGAASHSSDHSAERTGIALASGLCWAEARQRLAQGPPSVAARLRASLAKRFELLADELADYVRKSDWNRRHEPRGAEQTSPHRALELLAGPLAQHADQAANGQGAPAGQTSGRSRVTRLSRSLSQGLRLPGRPVAPVKVDLAAVKIEAALELAGCPVCWLAHEGARRWLFTLLWEGVTDPELRARIRSADGFCPAHWWHLHAVERGEIHGRTGLAILAEDTLRSLAGKLQAGSTPRGPTPAGCPACRAQHRAEHGALDGAARHLARPPFRALYLASHGCCPPHRQALADRLHDPELATVVLRHGE